MKQILYVILLLANILALPTAMGQNSKMKKANQLYDRFDYPAAAEIYKKLVSKNDDPMAKIKLAECYWKMNKSTEAEYWLEQVVDLPQSEDVHKLYYGMALKMNGKCDQARKVLMEYAQLVPADSRGLRLVESCDKKDYFEQDPGLYVIKPLDINTANSDFGPAYYMDGIVFSSASSGKYADKTYGWTQEPFLDLYYAQSQSKENPAALGSREEFKGKPNTEMHEGTVSFSKDFKTMYFTRNNFLNGRKGKDRDNTIRLKIFQALSDGDKWDQINNLPFNNDNYSVGHPALSEDGKLLYFASDMPGGYGETDIYVSRKTGNSWSAPENLGPEINTEGKEMFPFIHSDGTLYFSSDGLPGIGGLDVFSSNKVNGAWSSPENLRKPINSYSDDFGFVTNKTKDQGYLASNRPGSMGMDDIYAFSRAQFVINGIVVDAQTQEPIEGADVKLYFKDRSIQETQTKGDGSFSFPISLSMEYVVKAEKDKFINGQQPANTGGIEGNSMEIKIPLSRKVDQIRCELRGLVYDKDSGEAVEGAMVKLINSATKAEKIFNTPPDGRYQFDLEPETDYVIFGTKEYYFTTTKSVSTRGRDCSSPLMKDLALDIALTKIVVDVANPKVISKDVLDIKHIYYDLNKSNIRPDAAVELDKVVKLMYDNPGLIIELGSHTDSRSSDAYNMTLSQHRADAAVSYISSRGIASDRIKAHGYGETALINRCKNGVACDEEEHQQNRRTEFKVIGIQEGAPMYSEPRYYGTGYRATSTENVKSSFIQKGGEAPTVFDSDLLPEEKINTAEVYTGPANEFKIQVGALRNVNLRKFDNLRDIGQIETETAEGGITKILLGSYNDHTAAEKTLSTVRNRGFRDAFIVEYLDGNRLP